jgi:O-antigen ligase
MANRFLEKLHQKTPFLTEAALLFFLVGLIFPVKAAQSLGWASIVLLSLFALCKRPPIARNWVWMAACILMLLAGAWGMQVAIDPKVSWTAFWGYQTIGKGFLCAIALLTLPLSQSQLRRLLAFLLLMLFARNLQMLFYGYQHPVFLGGTDYANANNLLGYRSQGDHILLLFPFVLSAVFVWRKNINAALILMVFEIVLLASTGWRGAWVGFAGACLLLLSLYRAWRILAGLVLGSLVVGAIGLLVSENNIVALAINRGFGDSHRSEMVWRPVLEMIVQSNWQGYGFGQARFIDLIASYAAAHPDKKILVIGDAHNMVLNFAMAAGWLGALAYGAVVASGIVLCLQRLRDKNLLPEQSILLAGTAASWLGTYGLLGLSDQPHYNNLAMLAALTSVALANSRQIPSI